MGPAYAGACCALEKERTSIGNSQCMEIWVQVLIIYVNILLLCEWKDSENMPMNSWSWPPREIVHLGWAFSKWLMCSDYETFHPHLACIPADREFLGLTQEEFTRAPIYITAEVLLAATLCLWGEKASSDAKQPLPRCWTWNKHFTFRINLKCPWMSLSWMSSKELPSLIGGSGLAGTLKPINPLHSQRWACQLVAPSLEHTDLCLHRCSWYWKNIPCT